MDPIHSSYTGYVLAQAVAHPLLPPTLTRHDPQVCVDISAQHVSIQRTSSVCLIEKRRLRGVFSLAIMTTQTHDCSLGADYAIVVRISHTFGMKSDHDRYEDFQPPYSFYSHMGSRKSLFLLGLLAPQPFKSQTKTRPNINSISRCAQDGDPTPQTPDELPFGAGDNNNGDSNVLSTRRMAVRILDSRTPRTDVTIHAPIIHSGFTPYAAICKFAQTTKNSPSRTARE